MHRQRRLVTSVAVKCTVLDVLDRATVGAAAESRMRRIRRKLLERARDVADPYHGICGYDAHRDRHSLALVHCPARDGETVVEFVCPAVGNRDRWAVLFLLVTIA